MRRLNKRGMDDKLMFVIWEVIVILMVIIVLTISVRGIANNTNYWKKYHSSDLALMTDLITASQGDFIVNYNMKELRQNWATRTLRIDSPIFQTFIKEDSFFIYDQSIDKDRFPQSFIFAKNKDTKIIVSNTSSDYIVLYKKDNSISMKTTYISEIVTCSSENTKDNILEKKFDVVYLSEETKSYSQYINNLLHTVGEGTDTSSGLLIALTNITIGPTIIYYDSSSSSQIMSKKMACLVQKQLSQKFSDVDIQFQPYDNSLEIEPFKTQKNKYFYWILIKFNTNDIIPDNTKELGDSLQSAIKEYYG